MSSIKQITRMKRDKHMNTNREAGTTVASLRKTAIAAGVLYLITHVTSVGAAVLYGSILNNPDYIIGSGADTQVLLGAFFEVLLALAVVGTAVALFPVVKRWNESVALGYVGLRTLEAGIIAVGVVPLLAIITLRHEHGADGVPDVQVQACPAVHPRAGTDRRPIGLCI
jgi:hypothetical protein